MPHNMPGILVLVQLKAQSEEHEVLQHGCHFYVFTHPLQDEHILKIQLLHGVKIHITCTIG